eukprot:CAMPEP_0197657938 /NCGR_PEP_ID=MMETSP1338-20131121/44934_1 /TAXON_ID=43686 ORGANISM="Pelagodinium beii, Strain RCC1491" /NCGR_SAMPLE_ID=MMETSP1338 /ASSEMBLY_ACC=CAM_ASM_000754 /LENGTH=318 /DNA_ID=CAMNT_0043234419 /DNA_START=36 /DNA_END=992 /DNA_ORIENTATION=+
MAGGDGVKAKKGEAEEVTESPESLLGKLRPRRRFIFFLAFVAFCAWLMAFYDPCQIETSSRKDCGYSGISPTYCITGSCFTKGGGKKDKRVVKIEKPSDMRLGIEISMDSSSKKGDAQFIVESLVDGAVLLHNSKLPEGSADRIVAGDVISKVDGSKKNLDAALKKASGTVELEIRRSALPSYLQWLRSGSKAGTVETVLTSPGFKRWSKMTSQLSAVGFGCWLLSGYGTASLPGWYFGLSAAVGYKLVRCCHDESVPGGVPHCYKAAEDEPEVLVQKAYDSSVDFGKKLYKQWRSFYKDVYEAATGEKVKKSKKKKD